MITEKTEELLREHVPNLGAITYEKSTLSNVTTHWGVEWDERLLSRDFMQNFRDGNIENISGIVTKSLSNSVSIYGENEFELQRLFYLGSEKKGNQELIGNFGEGFKASALSVLRDFNTNPYIICGENILAISISDKVVKGTELRPLEYHWYKHDGDFTGTTLVLENAKKSLIVAVENSLEDFYYEEHPELGEKIFDKKDVKVYRTIDGNDGFGFYMGLRRVELPNCPFIFSLGKTYAEIEKKISQDRDRKAFGESIIKSYLRTMLKNLDGAISEEIIMSMRDVWHKGHIVISSIRGFPWGYKPEKISACKDAYLAKLSNEWNTPEEAIVLQKKLVNEGRILVPNYFSRLGFHDASDVIRINKEERLERIKNSHETKPTELEKDAIDFVIKQASSLSDSFLTGRIQIPYNFHIVESNDILGEFRSSNGFGDTSVALNRILFVGSFSTMFSTFLHEISHIYGYDGDRKFTDALTHLIESLIENIDKLQNAEIEWKKYRERIIEERKSNVNVNLNITIKDRLKAMSTKELSELIDKADESALKDVFQGL